MSLLNLGENFLGWKALEVWPCTTYLLVGICQVWDLRQMECQILSYHLMPIDCHKVHTSSRSFLLLKPASFWNQKWVWSAILVKIRGRVWAWVVKFQPFQFFRFSWNCLSVTFFNLPNCMCGFWKKSRKETLFFYLVTHKIPHPKEVKVLRIWMVLRTMKEGMNVVNPREILILIVINEFTVWAYSWVNHGNPFYGECSGVWGLTDFSKRHRDCTRIPD